MAYMALYRKYRPQTFDEVVGQDFVTRILKNQIKNDRVGHAYLLTGIRGTGKTTIAKIFARAINCPHNDNGNPCNVCDVCREIETPGVMDIIEIDAASNRGVDEIRDIKEQVKYPPTVGKYKVYIIDEVHMLTREAFNALLKTLEEPPSHVVFILATTEPNKLPTTILSRCQRFDIRPISQEQIAGRMRDILNDIGVAMDEEALQFIAARGDHSLRDALSILDQIIDIGEPGEPIHYDAVLDFLGMADQETILSLVDGLIRQDATAVLTELKTLQQEGKDAALIMDQLLSALRQLLVVSMTGKQAEQILGISDKQVTSYADLAKAAGKQRLFAMIDTLIEDQQKLRYNDMASVILEMCLLRICALGTETTPQNSTPVRQAPPKRPVAPRPKRSAPKTDHRHHPENHDASAKTVSQPEQPVSHLQAFQQKTAQIDAQQEQQRHHQDGQKTAAKPTETERPQAVSDTEKPAEETPRNDISPDRLFQLVDNELTREGKGFLKNIFEKGRFVMRGENAVALCYTGDGAKNYAGMVRSDIAGLEKIISRLAGRAMHLSVESGEKPYEAMTFEEKTRAIVGNVPVMAKHDK